MSIDLHQEPRNNLILNGALAAFSRYGFKRASLDDIAREAGISRPLLYLIYPNKAAIFKALATAMAERAIRLSQAAWPADMDFETGLAQSALVLNRDAWRLIKGSPHGAELVAENDAVVGEISQAVTEHFTNLIALRLKEAGHQPDQAPMIFAATHGIKDKATSEDELATNIARFAEIVASGLAK